MRGLFAAVPDNIRGFHAVNAAALAPVVARALRKGDAVLVKGSLGSGMKHVVEAIDSVAPAAGVG
jgi:UDP-N-acetylmuramoyl-tripeptide--D-alanyl-D-alanine ligase